MKKGYVKMNLLGEKYYIRKDIILEMISRHPEEVVAHIDREDLTAIVIDALIDEYDDSGYDDEEDEQIYEDNE